MSENIVWYVCEIAVAFVQEFYVPMARRHERHAAKHGEKCEIHENGGLGDASNGVGGL